MLEIRIEIVLLSKTWPRLYTKTVIKMVIIFQNTSTQEK